MFAWETLRLAPWLAGAFALVAILVNRFAPDQRRQLRRILILLALFVLFGGAASIARATGQKPWDNRFLITSRLFEAFCTLNLASTFFFGLFLPKIRIKVSQLASDLLVGVGYVLATLGVLAESGVSLSNILATSAVVSAVLALSLQATLGNVLGGVALQLDGSIHEGDWIQLDNGRQGKVQRIRWRHTVLETRDWSTILVPNSMLLASQILLLGKRGGEDVPQRIWIYFRVDFRHPPAHVIDVVQNALRSSEIPFVSDDPAPQVICSEFAQPGDDSYAVYGARYWLTDMAAHDQTNSQVRSRIYAALRRAGIPFARPSRTLFMNPDSAEQAERKKEEQIRVRYDAVETLELFDSLSDEEQRQMAEGLQYAPFSPGEVMTRQGAVAHFLYIITSGKAEIRRKNDSGQSVVVATIQGPTFFGEMGLMTGELRQADVVALTHVECYRLDKESFQTVIVARPEIAKRISEVLASRRVELVAKQENLDAAAMKARQASESDRILKRIEDFFGLDPKSTRR